MDGNHLHGTGTAHFCSAPLTLQKEYLLGKQKEFLLVFFFLNLLSSP